MELQSLFSAAAIAGGPHALRTPPDTLPTYDFNQSIPSQDTFPVETLAAIAADVVREDGGVALQYKDPSSRNFGFDELTYGFTGLRDEVAKFLNRRDNHDFGAENVLLSQGSVDALNLAVAAFVNPGDGAVVEAATFPLMTRALKLAGANVAFATLDRDGVVVEDVERQLVELDRQGTKPKLLYLGVDFQAPTGTVMPADRRAALLAVAKKWGLIVVEDAVYNELRYEGEQQPTLLSLAAGEVPVVQVGSFSKILAPGFRIGWAAGDRRLLDALSRARNDLAVSQWNSRVLQRWLSRGHYDAHISAARSLYRQRRDMADAALRKHCSGLVDYTAPAGAFYFWIGIDESVDLGRASAMALKAGVSVRSGESMTFDGSGAHYVRLAFAHVDQKVLSEGIEVFGHCLRESVA